MMQLEILQSISRRTEKNDGPIELRVCSTLFIRVLSTSIITTSVSPGLDDNDQITYFSYTCFASANESAALPFFLLLLLLFLLASRFYAFGEERDGRKEKNMQRRERSLHTRIDMHSVANARDR